MPDQLLTAVPDAGDLPVRRFDVSADANTWIRFEPDPHPPWIGVFGNPGNAQYCDLVPFPHDSDLILVVCGGQGYVVNRRTGELLRKTPWSYSYAAAPVPDSDRIVVADNSYVWCATPSTDIRSTATTSYWTSTGEAYRVAADGTMTPISPPPSDLEEIGTDGIIFLEATSRSLVGLSLHPGDGWYRFTLDFRSMSVERGPRIGADDEVPRVGSGRGDHLTEETIRRAESFRLRASESPP